MLNRSTLHTSSNTLWQSILIATTSVILKRVTLLCVVMLCSVMLLGLGRSASGARPQLLPRVLDDFTTGHFQEPQTLYSGNKRDSQTGSMVGGIRVTFFGVNSLVGQPGTLDIRPPLAGDADQDNGRLIVGTGYKAFHGLQVIYGHDQNGQLRPLNLNLCGYDRFRVHFEALTGGTNFNIVVFTNNGRGRAGLGYNVPPSGVPFDRDFEFSDFIAAQPLPETPNWRDADVIVFQPNSGGSAVGGNDFAIRSFTAVCGNPVNCLKTCLP